MYPSRFCIMGSGFDILFLVHAFRFLDSGSSTPQRVAPAKTLCGAPSLRNARRLLTSFIGIRFN